MPYLRGNTSTLEATDPTPAGAPGLKPHIIPDVLYPSYVASGTSNKMLDGTTALAAVTTGPNGSTVASSKFGTVQSDGRMYYYTNINGSKPIKDPRIGAHFGSQRHRATSIQLLEQETATHGLDVYSIDGREWFRAVGDNVATYNNTWGHTVNLNSNDNWYEITFYGIDLNMAMGHHNANRGFVISVDGAAESAEKTPAETTMSGDDNPKRGRYVDSAVLINVDVGATIGIHTVKIRPHSSGTNEISCSQLELIAQDTTSTATKSQIQIPAQNVVSYGKKFTVAASTPHYNPFAFAGDGTTAVNIGNTTSHGKVATGWTGSTSAYFDSTLDTATSLGLAAWEHSGDFYRPIMGGRIVKWVDSSGNIKTSVNMMPPAGTGIGNATGTNTPVAENWTTRYQPVEPHSTTIDHSQAEVAKSFLWREFGNGAANGSTNATYADCTMLDADDDIAYVMDDGLTSFSGESVDKHGSYEGWCLSTTGEDAYITFIGTGISIRQMNTSTLNWVWDLYLDGILLADGDTFNGQDWMTVAQNLPYQSHVLWFKQFQGSGAQIAVFGEYSFHQPKMPPIPENAVVIADYMLMADHVVVGSAGQHLISKGVRRVDASRDILYDHNAAMSALALFATSTSGIRQGWGSSNAASKAELPAFCTNQVHYGYDVAGRYMTYAIDSGSGYSNVTPTAKTGSADSAFYNNTGNAHTLGLAKHKVYGTAASSSAYVENIDVVSPIHTSSHYQPFETPHLFELVGGDRNMEQTNLVVTGDGKTWDEVTRDTSYIGNLSLCAQESAAYDTSGFITYTDWRGVIENEDMVQKDFAIAFDRNICLRTGSYKITVMSINRLSGTGEEAMQIYVNGELVYKGYFNTSSYSHVHTTRVLNLVRGDYVQIKGAFFAGVAFVGYNIVRHPDMKLIRDNEPTRHDIDSPEHRWGRTSAQRRDKHRAIAR